MWLKFIAALLQPPGLNVLLLLIGIYYWLRSNKFMSATFLAGGTIFLYLISTPVVSYKFLAQLENGYSTDKFSDLINQKDPKAIVALAAVNSWDSLTVHQHTSFLAKSSGLPILVSGNNYLSYADYGQNLVEAMAKSLASDFGITGAIWVEGNGNCLAENAKLVKQVLDQNSIKKIFLVTNSWRMSKAANAFKSQGIDVVPAPIPYKATISKSPLQNFTPSLECLSISSLFFYDKLQGLLDSIFVMYKK